MKKNLSANVDPTGGSRSNRGAAVWIVRIRSNSITFGQ
jgi:hypothetical protein